MFPILGALASAGLSYGSQWWNNREIQRANRAAQQHTLDMYERARKDNEKQWHMQNEYNSPINQMARYQEAGLNPNLIYGSGGAAQNSSPMPSVTAGGYNPAPRSFDSGSMVGNYFDTQLKTAQYDNLKAQNTVLLNQAGQLSANTLKTIAETDMSKFKLSQATRIKDISVDAAAESLRKLQFGNMFMKAENERRDQYAEQALKQSVETIIGMKLGQKEAEQRIKQLNTSNQILEFDRILKSQGLNPSDPTWMRALTQLVNNWLGQTPFDLFKKTFKK